MPCILRRSAEWQASPLYHVLIMCSNDSVSPLSSPAESCLHLDVSRFLLSGPAPPHSRYLDFSQWIFIRVFSGYFAPQPPQFSSVGPTWRTAAGLESATKPQNAWGAQLCTQSIQAMFDATCFLETENLLYAGLLINDHAVPTSRREVIVSTGDLALLKP